MANFDFEFERDMEPIVKRLLMLSPPFCSTDVQMLLAENYETHYGIHNHDHENPDRPLILVAMQPGEDNFSHSLLHERIRLFKYLEVAKHYGLSFTEFMELPTYIAEEVLLECAQDKKVVDAATQGMIDKMKEGK